MKNIFKGRKRAVSLIKGVLYLVIALAVIVGGLVFFQQAQRASDITEASRVGLSVSTELRGLYKNQRSMGPQADITNVAIKSSAVPAKYVTGSTLIDFPAGGRMYVFSDNERFVMLLTEVSRAACVRLTSINEEGEGPMGTNILGVKVEDALDQDDPSAHEQMISNFSPLDYIVPYTSADAQANCIDGAAVMIAYDRGYASRSSAPPAVIQ